MAISATAARFASGYLAAALTPDEQPAGETAVDEAHVYREVG
jgi:hypothetical protein